jgi:hypothetical protein
MLGFLSRDTSRRSALDPESATGKDTLENRRRRKPYLFFFFFSLRYTVFYHRAAIELKRQW